MNKDESISIGMPHLKKSWRIEKKRKRMIERSLAWMEVASTHAYPRLCTVCTYEGLFAPYQNLLDARCPNCNSRYHHRLFKLWLDEKNPINKKNKLLHFAPEWGVRPILESLCGEYRSADIGERGDLTLDITAIELPDGQYDVIICHQVIEHVDDKKALSELFRVLRPGGFVVLTTPVIEGWEKTYDNEEIISRRERILHFGQGDHTRFYGRDFRTRILNAGFNLEEYVAVEPFVSRHSLERGARLFIAHKPTE